MRSLRFCHLLLSLIGCQVDEMFDSDEEMEELSESEEEVVDEQ